MGGAIDTPAEPGARRRSGLITLTTDFGEKDPFVGVMKGVIYGRWRDARIVDVTHQISAYAPAEAGFWLERSFRWFPAGTVHVAVVDPGVGTSRGVLAVESAGHTFLAPDNGLLQPILAEDPAAVIVRIDLAKLQVILGLPAPSATFHGRDVFAPLAAELAADRVDPRNLGSIVPGAHALVPSSVPAPTSWADRIDGRVVTIDRFGNAITNLRSESLARFRDPVVHASGRVLRLVRTYGEARRGEHVALFGAFDALELAEVEGNAAKTLNLEVGAIVSVSGRSG